MIDNNCILCKKYDGALHCRSFVANMIGGCNTYTPTIKATAVSWLEPIDFKEVLHELSKDRR